MERRYSSREDYDLMLLVVCAAVEVLLLCEVENRWFTERQITNGALKL